MTQLAVIILAAGKGTRMKSDLPKVCHKVGNKTMIEHVVTSAKGLETEGIYVVVSKENIEIIRNILRDTDVRFKIQHEQLGTAHAVISAMPCCDNSRDILVLLGDVPLVKTRTLNKIVSTRCDAVIVGFHNSNPANKFGRIIVKNNRVNKIVEYNDATEEEKNIQLCNSGMLWLKSKHVPLLTSIKNNNNKSEYYLTDIIGIMVNRGLDIGFLEISYEECMGVNTPEDLAEVNQIYNKLNSV
jgi:bifunctional UDP-N-acetylglucosamine pyrophosphorylase/glucosamine-1-phosphate N-acetyltransferase